MDESNTKLEIEAQLKPRGSVLRKRTQNLPTSGRSCRLNPPDQLDRLCVYRIYKRTMRGLTKQSVLARADADIRGKNTQE